MSQIQIWILKREIILATNRTKIPTESLFLRRRSRRIWSISFQSTACRSNQTDRVIAGERSSRPNPTPELVIPMVEKLRNGKPTILEVGTWEKLLKQLEKRRDTPQQFSDSASYEAAFPQNVLQKPWSQRRRGLWWHSLGLTCHIPEPRARPRSWGWKPWFFCGRATGSRSPPREPSPSTTLEVNLNSHKSLSFNSLLDDDDIHDIAYSCC